MKDTHSSDFKKAAAEQDYEESIAYYNAHEELHPHTVEVPDDVLFDRALRAVTSLRLQLNHDNTEG